jgi:hypothetical protein
MLLDTAGLSDDPAPAPEPAPSPVARRSGDTPTPFGQLTGQRAAPPADAAVTAWLVGAALVALLAFAVWALWPPVAPAPVAPAAEAASAPAQAEPPALALARPVVAFDAPHGAALGALEAGRPYAVAQERDGWRQLDAAGSGLVWVRAWEMDGTPAPLPTPQPTAAPAPPRPAPAPVVAPVGPAVTCLPVIDADNNNAYLGEACGATSAERQRRALELLQAAPCGAGCQP